MNINAAHMLATAATACDLLKTVANPHRLVILCQLVDGEKSVGDLAAFLGIRQTTVSQNLALMRSGGLVSARRDGQTVWYSIKSTEARLLLETLYKIYCTPAPLRSNAQKPQRTPRRKHLAETKSRIRKAE